MRGAVSRMAKWSMWKLLVKKASMYNCWVGITPVESPYSVRRRLCDSWTKSDDDKVETSRMGNDNDKVVNVNDND